MAGFYLPPVAGFYLSSPIFLHLPPEAGSLVNRASSLASSLASSFASASQWSGVLRRVLVHRDHHPSQDSAPLSVDCPPMILTVLVVGFHQLVKHTDMKQGWSEAFMSRKIAHTH